MKTTVELPDAVLRDAKSVAAAQGTSLRAFITDALVEKLGSLRARGRRRPWMRHFGSSADHLQEIRRIDLLVQREFEVVRAEDWR